MSNLGERWKILERCLDKPNNSYSVETHALLSCFKVLSTSQGQLRIQPLRELMGGHGYSLYSLIGNYRNNNDMNVTMYTNYTSNNINTINTNINNINKFIIAYIVKEPM